MTTASTGFYLICATVLMASLIVHGAAIKEHKEVTKDVAIDEKVKQSPTLDRAPRSIGGLSKRPFCNAFTGCGRKRSGGGGGGGLTNEQMPRDAPVNSMENESVNNLFDFNSEPAVADIMQQIMSEAKLFEAIQAANRELKKQSAMNHNNFPTFSAQ